MLKVQYVSMQKFQASNIIIFGGDGDLAYRKIYPALFEIWKSGLLKDKMLIYPVVRKTAKKQFLDRLSDALQTHLKHENDQDSNNIKSFFEIVEYVKISLPNEQEYKVLKSLLDGSKGFQNIYYFSTPSKAFGEISHLLKKMNLIDSSSKVVLEKPIGNKLSSFEKINNQIASAFAENQIYRIDHYLGKETVQNLMVLRFSNHLFEKSWNRDHIENIQITVAESIGVETRGNFYNETGALLDMVQNHLLQILCLVAMDPPHALNAESVRNEKLKVLKALRKFDENTPHNQSVKGQYTRGQINNVEVGSYLEDIELYHSSIETFVALRVYIDNWRWKNVPFYLRTGKRLAKRYSEIVINFKPVCHNIFNSAQTLENNKLIIRLQPEERIELVQLTKIPGPGGYRYKPISLKLDFIDSFEKRLPNAYERLIFDIIRGNQTLFMSDKELIASWSWIDGLISHWQQSSKQNELYKSGSWGPSHKVLLQDDHWFINE